METDVQTQLIVAVRAGDTSSFGTLYDTFVRDIYRFVYYKTHHKEIAEDLTSQVFMKAFEKIGTYNEKKGGFRTWLYQIARNTVIDHYRSEKETKSIEDAWDVVSADDTSALADKNLQIEQVKKYLQLLKSEQRDIVIMRLWQDMSYKEIAEILGKSEASCKMSFSRSLKELQKIMPEAIFLSLLCAGFHSLIV